MEYAVHEAVPLEATEACDCIKQLVELLPGDEAICQRESWNYRVERAQALTSSDNCEGFGEALGVGRAP